MAIDPLARKKLNKRPVLIDTTFFHFSAWIAFFCSLYTLYLLFNSGSLLWILLGSCLLVVFRCITQGANNVSQSLYIPGFSSQLSKSILWFSGFSYFISSMNGLIDILFRLPFHDKSFLLFPLLISACFFAGASISVVQVD